MKVDYVKRMPATGAFVALFDHRYRQLGESRPLLATAIAGRLIEANGALKKAAAFAEIWERAEGESQLVALLVPKRCLAMTELRDAAFPFGDWMLATTATLGLGPHVVMSRAMVAQTSARAAERLPFLPLSTSWEPIAASGYRPERGDVWWEAESSELVDGYTFECLGIEHRFYCCAESWASRFSVRNIGTLEWTDVFGANPALAPPVTKTSSRKTRAARPKNDTTADVNREALLARGGRHEDLIALLGPSETLYTWLTVAAALGFAESARTLASLREEHASRWGDETVAAMHFDVARWFALGEKSLERAPSQALAQLELAFRLDPSGIRARADDLAALRAALPTGARRRAFDRLVNE